MSCLVEIHENKTAVPVEPAPRKDIVSYEKGRPEGDKTPGDDHTRGIVPVPRGIRRIPPRAVCIVRIVRRYIDHLRVSRFDHDILVFDGDCLLFGRLEVSLLFRPSAQVLYGCHDIILLSQIGISELSCLV